MRLRYVCKAVDEVHDRKDPSPCTIPQLIGRGGGEKGGIKKAIKKRPIFHSRSDRARPGPAEGKGRPGLT